VVANNRPLRDAEVRMAGQTRLTDADGHFRFESVDTGRSVITVQHLGYATRQDTLEVRPGIIDVLIPLEELAIELEPLVVTVRGMTDGFEEFYERRERGEGYFVTRAEFERFAPVRMSDVLRTVPGIRLLCSGNTCNFEMSRSAPSLWADPTSAGGCPPQVYVDGARWRSDGWLDLDFSPAEVAAVEVYRGPSEVPTRFGGGQRARCGVIVIWTRKR